MALPIKDVLASVVVLCFFALSRAQEVLIVESFADSACSGTVVSKSYEGVVNQCASHTWNGYSYWRVPTKSITGLVMLTYYSDPNCTTRHTDTSSGPQLVEAMAGNCTPLSTIPAVWRKYTSSSSTPALVGLNIHLFSTPAMCLGATLVNQLYITSLECVPKADIDSGRPLEPKSQLVTATGNNSYTMVEYSTYNCTGPSKTPASQFTCDCSCGSFSGLGMYSWSCGNALTPSPAPSCLAASSTSSSTTSSTTSSTVHVAGQVPTPSPNPLQVTRATKITVVPSTILYNLSPFTVVTLMGSVMGDKFQWSAPNAGNCAAFSNTSDSSARGDNFTFLGGTDQVVQVSPPGPGTYQLCYRFGDAGGQPGTWLQTYGVLTVNEGAAPTPAPMMPAPTPSSLQVTSATKITVVPSTFSNKNQLPFSVTLMGSVMGDSYRFMPPNENCADAPVEFWNWLARTDAVVEFWTSAPATYQLCFRLNYEVRGEPPSGIVQQTYGVITVTDGAAPTPAPMMPAPTPMPTDTASSTCVPFVTQVADEMGCEECTTWPCAWKPCSAQRPQVCGSAGS